MRMLLSVSIILGSLLLGACANINKKPETTRITEEGQVLGGGFTQRQSYAESVFVDARSPLQVRLWSLPQAQPLWWRDYKFDWTNFEDSYQVARRLAALGIGPDTEVFVLGAGLAGEGEEGYIAFMLKFLGVKKVTLREAMDFRAAKLSGEPVKPPSLPIWKPTPHTDILFAKEDFTRGLPEGRLVLDVRPANLYLQTSDRDPDLQALNVPWTQFYKSMREGKSTYEEFLRDLEPVGVQKDRYIVIISEDEVHASLVSFLLSSSGFSKVMVYMPGYSGLRGPLKE